MKSYVVLEDELLELLTAYHELTALKNGGVDNWKRAGCSCSDYLSGAGKESFEEMAAEDLSAYEEI